MGGIGTAISGASAIGNLASGGKGNTTSLYQSAGGITPEQQALADYTFGQDELQAINQFGGSDEGGGAGMSSMTTQMTGGAQMGKALNEAKYSDTNELEGYAAQQAAQGAANATTQQNLGDLTSLSKLASSASTSGGQASTITG